MFDHELESLRKSSISRLFSIEYPIIQGGMIWVSGAKLAAAVSNAGGLGLIGAGSMRPDVFIEHLKKAQNLTQKPFGVNIPLLYKYSKEHIDNALRLGVRIFFTSAGSPRTYTSYLKEHGAKVVHVCSSPDLALKCEAAGVDAVVAEGFEAGGHNGRDELTTFCLIPMVKQAVSIPVIAAGGIASGAGLLAALALGAEGVQMGTRFALSEESSAHPAFKQAILNADATSTRLVLKKLVPVRLLKNKFAEQVEELEARGASSEELARLLGQGRSRLGMHEGNLEEGELEIGQVAGLLKDISPVSQIMHNILGEYLEVKKRLL